MTARAARAWRLQVRDGVPHAVRLLVHAWHRVGALEEPLCCDLVVLRPDGVSRPALLCGTYGRTIGDQAASSTVTVTLLRVSSACEMCVPGLCVRRCKSAHAKHVNVAMCNKRDIFVLDARRALQYAMRR